MPRFPSGYDLGRNCCSLFFSLVAGWEPQFDQSISFFYIYDLLIMGLFFVVVDVLNYYPCAFVVLTFRGLEPFLFPRVHALIID